MHAALAGRYRVLRPFLVLLAEALPLAAAPARQKTLTVVRGLPGLAPGGCGSARLPAPRSTLPWCRRCGAARCTATGIFPPGRWTGMPTCCASWSSCVPRCAAVTCSPRRRCGGPLRGRCRWTGPAWGGGQAGDHRQAWGWPGPPGKHLRDLARSLDAAWRCLGTWRRLRPAAGEPPVGTSTCATSLPRRSAEFADSRPLVFRLCFSPARRRSPGRS